MKMYKQVLSPLFQVPTIHSSYTCPRLSYDRRSQQLLV